MAIILHCKHENGAISQHAEHIDGVLVPIRIYRIKDHVLTLDGYDESVLWHDVEELIANHGSIYRHMTPAEQEAYAATKRAQTMIQE